MTVNHCGLAAIFAGILTLGACSENHRAEETAEDFEEAVEETSDIVEDNIEEVEQSSERLKRSLDDIGKDDDDNDGGRENVGSGDGPDR